MYGATLKVFASRPENCAAMAPRKITTGALPDRTNEPWHKQLIDMLAGPYAGYGGRKALARDLEISDRALDFYTTTSVHRRDPNFEVRGRIKSLWRIHHPDARE